MDLVPVAENIVVLPKSVTPSRIASNLTGTLDVLPRIEKAEFEALNALAANGKQKRFVTPPWGASLHPFLTRLKLIPISVIDLGFDNWP